MRIQVTGPGCSKCQTTARSVFNACAELNLPAKISHVFNVAECLSLGVTSTPAVRADSEIVLAGKAPTVLAPVEILAPRR